MAPRGQTLPQAATESAREARKSFFCELCQKGYARMNDFEAHEGSYDHQHRKRLKEMKQLTRDPNAASKAREAERKANEEAGLKSINLNMSGASIAPVKKKPVFKSTLQPQNAAAIGLQPTAISSLKTATSTQDVDMADEGDEGLAEEYSADPSQMQANGWAAERYDPRFVAGYCARCRGRCSGSCGGVGGKFDARESYEEWSTRKKPEIEERSKRLRGVAIGDVGMMGLW